ncbi:MAG: hypothetical protein ACWGQW_15775 [bacterium]
MTTDRQREAIAMTMATHDLCVELAKELEGEAMPIPSEYKQYHYPLGCCIELSNNKVLGFTPKIEVKIISHKPTHIKVRGLYPVSKKAGAFNPLVAPLAVTTANRMRTPKQLARQIRGRFMETFLPVLENCILDMQNEERKIEMSEAEAALIRSIIGNNRLNKKTSTSTVLFFDSPEKTTDLKVMCCGGSIEIKWSCNADEAARFAQLYKQLAEEKASKKG